MKNKTITNFSKIVLLIVFAIISFTSNSQKLHSVKSSAHAYPYPISYTQPDGSIITVSIKGDMFLNWAKTTDGYTLVKNNNNGLDYAKTDAEGNLVPSGISAKEIDKRTSEEQAFLKSISKDLMFSNKQINNAKSKSSKSSKSANAFPSIGTRNLLMILVNFNNTNTSYTQSNFDNYMNQVGYNFQGASGSFRDFYLDNSYNQLTINTTVTAWVTVNNPHDYYGPVSKWKDLAYDAIVAAHNADSTLDFSQFDNDGDGKVDGIAIIHQGTGQESSLNANDVWSNTNYLNSFYTLVYNGVVIDSYTLEPEKSGTNMSGIGIMCHEFGHNLGLPDLYSTDYSSKGMGTWDLMAGGEWNNTGKTPSNHGAWNKSVLNWITPITLTNAFTGTNTLHDASLSTDCYKIPTTSANEYFLLENRQKTGWDTYLPGHGMIIYHIDDSLINSTWGAGNNIVNNDPNHQGVDILEADNTYTTDFNGDNGDPFPGSGNNTAFTDGTTPSSKSWAGVNSNLPITNITENTSTHDITFCLFGCTPDNLKADFYASTNSVIAGKTVTFTSTPITPSGTTITDYEWTFTGGTPASYNGQTPPPITYNLTGTYNVSLKIKNSNGDSSIVAKNNYIKAYLRPIGNWTLQNSAFPIAFTAVAYMSIVDTNTVWAIGMNVNTNEALRVFTKTTNGGTTWQAISMSGVTVGDIPSNICALSSTTAYIATYNETKPDSAGIFVTTDGGINWTKQPTAAFSGSASFPNLVHFFNTNDGFCMGDPNGGYFEIYTTSDGGINWTRVPQADISPKLNGEAGGCDMYDVAGDTAWFATSKGRVFKSVDKGLHWTAYSTGFNRMVIKFNDAYNGIAVQPSNYGGASSIKVTHDGGETWTSIVTGSGMYFTDFDAIPDIPGKYISVGLDLNNNFGSSFTLDYGASWNNIDFGTPYISVKFFDDNTGWAGSLNTNSTTGGIYKFNPISYSFIEPVINKHEGLIIYPNPSSDIVNLQIIGVGKQHLKVRIYNLMGMVVYQQNDFNVFYNYNKAINVSSFSKGVYIVVIESDTEVFKKKIIVE